MFFFIGLRWHFFGHVLGLTNPKNVKKQVYVCLYLARIHFWCALYNWFASHVFFLLIFEIFFFLTFLFFTLLRVAVTNLARWNLLFTLYSWFTRHIFFDILILDVLEFFLTFTLLGVAVIDLAQWNFVMCPVFVQLFSSNPIRLG